MKYTLFRGDGLHRIARVNRAGLRSQELLGLLQFMRIKKDMDITHLHSMQGW